MSTIFANRVIVSGPEADVHLLRVAARRRIPEHRVEHFLRKEEPWSFEKLFRRHPALRAECGEPPRDDWHYWTESSRVDRCNEHWQFRFFLEVKDFQIHEILCPLSRLYPALCFVAVELCLDDGSFTSRFIHQGKASTWELPESSADAHWLRAARKLGIERMEDAYEDDAVIDDAESGMFLEALAHWDERVRDALH